MGEMNEKSKELTRWADKAMFKAEEIDVEAGPQVKLLSCNSDPLGTIAAAAKMYEGKSVSSLADITDGERQYYLEQTAKTALAAPLEFVNFHFIISGVTRGFTHQMVRQRTATYTQESTRFAVKETVPVGRPPSLDGTMRWSAWLKKCGDELYPAMPSSQEYTENQLDLVQTYAMHQASTPQLWRRDWDEYVEETSTVYNGLVSAGMPAEDARGLLPTNLLTRINYNSSLRGLLEHSGVRLCTQAQFEWRLVWTEMLKAIKNYRAVYETKVETDEATTITLHDSYWQFEALAEIFKPICYQKGSCQFNADVDRACSIKGRVERFAGLGIPSVKWPIGALQQGGGTTIPPIHDSEWMLDPMAARVSQ